MPKNAENKNTEHETAVIVGGSLAGLMTGIALAQEGIHVTILEKANEQRGIGGGLQVNGGLFDCSKTARLLRKLAVGGSNSIQLWSSIESRLRTEVLSDKHIDLRFNTRIQSIDQDAVSAWAVTEDGEVFKGDILIGADGHRSLVRRYVAPHKPDAAFAGYIVWMASLEEEEIPEEYRPANRGSKVTMLDSFNGFLFGNVIDRRDDTNVKSRRIGCAWYDNTRNDLLRRLGCVEESTVHHSLKGADIPKEALKDLSEQAAVRWPEPWLSITQHALRTRNVIGIPIKEYIPDNLINGRVAIVGDAAHAPAPITASGVNESLKDAVSIGKYAGKGIKGNTAIDALNKYESARLNEVRQVVRSGHGFSQSFGRP